MTDLSYPRGAFRAVGTGEPEKGSCCLSKEGLANPEGQEISGFALQIGEAEIDHTWEEFKQSVLLNSKLKINDETAEY
ncbi:MAG: hypothetical protein ACYT04_99290, partial [Nostoc sp.]